MKLKEWLQKGEAGLRGGAHPERARPDAQLLLLYLLGKDKAWLMAHADEALPAAAVNRYEELLERRHRGEPIQYITGETEFYGLSLRVTPDVLIPRPETEHLVEKALEEAVRFHAPRILDVGVGSGAIAVALACKLPQAAITAIDLSSPALAIARQNAQRNGVAGRIRFLHGDLLAPVQEEQFEMVVSNPPYVPVGDRASLAVEVREYEPAQALFAGPSPDSDGLDVCRRLIPAAFAALLPGGFLAIEIGSGQSPAIHTLLTDSGFEGIEFIPDLQKIPRVACARRP